MFTLNVQDEAIYQRLMVKAAQHGGSLDDALRELLDSSPEVQETDNPEDMANQDEETPVQKLLRLIDETEMIFYNPFDAIDAEDILSREMRAITWRE
jgi:plasmid stability protein